MQEQGINFIDRIYKDLHISDEVMHTAEPSYSKKEKLTKYFDRLERIDNKVKNSKYNDLSLIKKLFYDKYVIKESSIPESYFELQKQIAFERGYGHVYIMEDTRNEMCNMIIEDQKKSLDEWLEYLVQNDAKYPEWFKYYALQGMLKLGSYNKETGKISKRNKNTTNKFIELDTEVLSKIYNGIVKVINNEEVGDATLKKLIDNGSFGKLYAYELNNKKNNKDISNTEGIWIKYEKNSDPQALVNSLNGRGTGWCTAGYETARLQLQNGDFYVYYTKDSTGEYKQPRIAIRMEENSIGEIRGIAEKQNIEPEMINILDEKIKEFPDKDLYMKKVKDMEKLTKIYNSYQCRELSLDELKFLYETESDIKAFGYRRDIRIDEILNTRDYKKDLSRVYNCNEDEISKNVNDIANGKKIKVFLGDLDFEYENNNYNQNVIDLTFPEIVFGEVRIHNFDHLENVTLPRTFKSRLALYNIRKVKNIKMPEKIRYNEYSEISISVQEFDNTEITQEIFDVLFLYGTKIIKNIKFPKYLKGHIDLVTIVAASNITFPEILDGGLYLDFIKECENIVFPTKIKDDLNLNNLIFQNNVLFPKEIGGNLNMYNLQSTKVLVLPRKIGGTLNIEKLKEIEDLTIPQNFQCKEFNSNYYTLDQFKNINNKKSSL